MRVLEIVRKENKGRFFLNEFTTQYGSIQFVQNKGGSISNSYYYKFNKTIQEERDIKRNIISEVGSFIEFYINKETQYILNE